MVVRIRDWEIDIGELLRRIRSDWRYALAALGVLFLFCACGWLVFVPRPVPHAAVVVVGPEDVVVHAGRETFSGPGPHRIPAGKISLRIEAAGYYPTGVELELSPNTTTTVTPTLYPRPEIREIAGLPGSRVESVCLLDGAVRFRTAVTSTVSTASSPSGGFWPAPARTEERVEMLWWSMTPDGRKERILSLEGGPAAEEGGRTALVRPEGLFLVEGGESRLLYTNTSAVEGLAWWGEDLLLMRSVPTGVSLEVLGDVPAVTATVTQTYFLALLPAAPDPYCFLESPDRLVLRMPGGAADTFLALDVDGKVQYLTDISSSPLPWAFIAAGDGSLVWAVPTPSGWAVYRLAGEKSVLLAEVPDLHGLWTEGEEVFYLDGQGRARKISGEVLYAVEEIDPQKDFILWRKDGSAVLWNGGKYFLLSWPGGEDE